MGRPGRVPAGARAGREGEPPLRLLFAGTPAPAVPSLEALLASDHEVVAVLTRPDARSGPRPQGRAGPRWPSGPTPPGMPGAAAALAARAGVPRAAGRARRRLRAGRRLRRARAAGRARPAPARLGQPALLAAARPGGAPRPCSTRSWPATRSPAPRRSGSRPGSTPARCSARSPSRSARGTPPATCWAGSPSAARGCWSPPSTGSPPARLVAEPQPGRGHQPGAADRARRRPGRLVAARPRRRPPDPRGHPRARAPGRRGAASGCGSGRCSRCPRSTWSPPASCAVGPERRARGHRPRRRPARRRAAGRQADVPGRRLGPRRAAAARRAGGRVTGLPGSPAATGTAAASGHPPAGARRRPADRLRRARRRLLARPPTPTCCCPQLLRERRAGGARRRVRHPARLRHAARAGHARRDPHRPGVPAAGRARPAGARPAPAGRLPADRPAGAVARRRRHDRRPHPRASSAPAPPGWSTPCCARSPPAATARSGWPPSAGTASERLALATNHPRWIVDAWRDALGLATTSSRRRCWPTTPRPRCTWSPAGSTARRWSRSPAASRDRGRRSPSGCTAATPGRLPSVRSGAAAVQDEGSQLAALLLARAPLEGPDAAWLDMCAGPGGKTGLLAAVRPDGVRLTAADRAPHRAELVAPGRWPVCRTSRCWPPTARGRRGRRVVRPGAARRPVHRAGRAAPPSGGALAPDAGRRPARWSNCRRRCSTAR